MNNIESDMVEVLKRLQGDFGVVSVKAEFEAEGTRSDELLRLVEVASRAGLSLTLKIGGCEAIRDLMEAKQFGSSHVVAPMVESAYALQKFVAAIDVVYDSDERKNTDFLFNIETVTGYEALDDLMSVVSSTDSISGAVFGRVDFAGSLNFNKSEVLHEEVTSAALQVAKKIAGLNLDFVVGGGVSSDSLATLRQVKSVLLARFETRKVVFSADALDIPEIEAGLLLAVQFELLWLQNKQNYYTRAAGEDQARISMLESRWGQIAG